MKKEVEFGECLRMLLSSSGLNSSRLARSINLDPSVVSRWINGKRVPALDTVYVNSIANCLAHNIQNSFQRKQLEEALLMLCGESKLKGTLEEQIKFALSEAQGYSLKRQKNARKKSASSAKPNEHRVIRGYDNIYQSYVTILNNAAHHEPPEGEAICLFLDTYNDSRAFNRKLEDLSASLQKVLHKGWKIKLLFRLNENLEQTVDLVKIMDPLLTTGQFEPYFFKKYDVFTIGREILTVPNIGALSCFPTKDDFIVDSGYCISMPEEIELLQNYFNYLITNLAQPLLKIYSAADSFRFADCLSGSGTHLGTRITYKYSFSTLLFPKNLYRKFLNRTSLSPEEKQKAWQLYEKSLEDFLTNLKHFAHKDIYPLDSCLDLFEQKTFYFCSSGGIEAIKLDNREIVELLQNIVYLLEKYDNYYLGISHQNDSSKRHDYFSYKVIEDQIIIMESYKREQAGKGFKLAIEEPIMVKAWNKYLEELWGHISPVYRCKREVIKWLKNIINHLDE